MHSRYYESVVLINAALEDDQIETIITRIKDLITSNGGEILETDKWGRKRLAYPIQKAKSGYYLVLRFKSSPEFISVLERQYRLDESITRYLTIVLDKFALEAIAKQKETSKTAEVVEEVIDTTNGSNE